MHKPAALSVLVLAGAVALTAPPAAADFVVQPTAVDATSSGGSGDRSPSNAINSDGLIPNGSNVQTDDPTPSTWPAHDDFCCEGLWKATELTPRISFDLGAPYKLTGAHVWNYNESGRWTGRGADEVEISFSTTAIDSGFGAAQTFNFPEAPGTTSYTGEDHAFSGAPITARYVKFNINSNHGESESGLSEVRFLAIPEPASLSLLAPAGLLLAARRRSAPHRRHH